MTNDEVISLLEGIDGFYGTKITHPKFGDENVVKHWTAKLSKLPTGNCNRVITALQELSLSHKKPSAPSLGMFLAKYNVMYKDDEMDAQSVLKSDCSFCRNGRVTVVWAGDHHTSMAIISTKDGMCRKLKPRNASGLYTYYSTETQPCSHCDKGFAVNAGFKYEGAKLHQINDHAFQDDIAAAEWFGYGEFNIPYFVKYLNKTQDKEIAQ